MNNSSPILFACPYCYSALSVPAEFSGVTAPCPKCALPITAPLNASTPAAGPYPGAAPTAATVASNGYFDDPKPGEAIRPEPRGLAPRPQAPTADHVSPVSAQQRAADATSPDGEYRSRRQNNSSRKLLRLVIPCLLLLALAFAFLKLADFLKVNSLTQPQTEPSDKQLKSVWDSPATPHTSLNKLHGPTPPPAAGPQDTPPAKTVIEQTPVSPDIVIIKPIPISEPKTDPTPEPEEPQAGAVAYKTMEQFLAAKSFQERLLYVQTKLPEAELQNTILGYNWPTAIVTPGSQIPHPKERLIEFYYEVRFGENSQKFPRVATILVHKRGNEAPKVLLEPLLDTIGGRLATFAKKPVSGTFDFYTMMEAHPHCFTPEIPEASKKSTFDLRAHITGEIIASAYANEQSTVLKEFADPLTGMKWRNPTPVVVTLQWNASEAPSRPFIELIAIKSRDWRN